MMMSEQGGQRKALTRKLDPEKKRPCEFLTVSLSHPEQGEGKEARGKGTLIGTSDHHHEGIQIGEGFPQPLLGLLHLLLLPFQDSPDASHGRVEGNMLWARISSNRRCLR